MLRDWIINARKKPKHVRNNIAMGAAGSFTAVVFIIWFMVSPGKMLIGEAVEKEESPKPFATLFHQIKEQVAGVGEAVSDTATTTAVAPAENRPVELDASSNNWALSSTTVKEKAIPREVPIMIIPRGSSTAPTTTAERNL